MTPASVAVLGLGGVGGMLAVRTRALCVGTERTVAAIRTRGLTLVQDGSTTVERLEALDRLERPVSLLVIAVKAYDLDAALERIAPGALDGAVALSLLNGLDHVAVLRARFRHAGYKLLQVPPVVAAGSIGRVSAWSPEPGVVVQDTAMPVKIEAASRDLESDALATALTPLDVPGVELEVRDDERGVLWEKAARLAVLAAATVASGLPVGTLRDDPAWRERLRGALEEAVAVAASDAVQLNVATQWAMIEAMPATLQTSAARDAAAGRPTELDAITGSVIRAGAHLGVPVPALSALFEEASCRVRSH